MNKANDLLTTQTVVYASISEAKFSAFILEWVCMLRKCFFFMLCYELFKKVKKKTVHLNIVLR